MNWEICAGSLQKIFILSVVGPSNSARQCGSLLSLLHSSWVSSSAHKYPQSCNDKIVIPIPSHASNFLMTPVSVAVVWHETLCFAFALSCSRLLVFFFLSPNYNFSESLLYPKLLPFLPENILKAQSGRKTLSVSYRIPSGLFLNYESLGLRLRMT